MVAKGWAFVGLADETRRRAHDEKRATPADVVSADAQVAAVPDRKRR
jgi:hypothetical protein